jgi:hypothetical protein
MRNSTSFKTITAKYSGSTCRRCNQPIAVGESFRYGGPGRTYHLADRCQNGALAFVAPAAVTDAPTPTPQQLMTATIASSLQQTFSDLLARPAKIGDIEARIIAPVVIDTTAAAETIPQASTPQQEDARIRATVANNGSQFLRNALAARKAPQPRRRSFAFTAPQPVSADDLL